MPDRIFDADPELHATADVERRKHNAARRRQPNGHDTSGGVSLDDFFAYMPMHSYIYAPTMAAWPAASVNSRIPPIRLTNGAGEPVLDNGGKPVMLSASAWLDRNRPVEQMTWAPGLPTTIPGKLVLEGGWIDRPGVSCLNLYRPPTILPGDPTKAERWVEHVHYLYPADADHLIMGVTGVSTDGSELTQRAGARSSWRISRTLRSRCRPPVSNPRISSHTFANASISALVGGCPSYPMLCPRVRGLALRLYAEGD